MEPQFEALSDFNNGRGSAMVQQKQETKSDDGVISIPEFSQFLIDESGHLIGNPVSSYNYRMYYPFSPDGIAVAEHLLVGLLGYSFIDKSGNILPVEEPLLQNKDSEWAKELINYHKENPFMDVTRFGNGYAAVTFDNESWFFINRYFVPVTKGDEVLFFDGAKPFSSGLAAVKKEDKWGYVNLSFDEVIPYQYDSCTSFVGDLAKVFVKTGNILVESYIDKENKIVWQQLVKTKKHSH